MGSWVMNSKNNAYNIYELFPLKENQLPQKAGRLPLQQHLAYGYAMASHGVIPDYYGLKNKETGTIDASVLCMTRRFGIFFTLTTIMRGPVWHLDPTLRQQEYAFTILQNLAKPWRRRFVIQMPDLDSGSDAEKALKAIGLKRVMTGWHTAWLPLKSADPDQRHQYSSKWRNQLVKAEKNDALICCYDQNPKSKGFNWICDREREQKKIRGYAALPLDFLDHYARYAPIVAVTILYGSEIIAGALFLCHAKSATYHIGVTSDKGRKHYAHNLMLHRAMLYLAKKGIRHLDLGGLDTVNMAGIARFKIGMKPDVTSLTGAWSR